MQAQNTLPQENGGLSDTNMQGIYDVLQRHCGVPICRWFVAAAADDGTFTTFTNGRHRLSETVVRQFFDADRFQQVIDRIEAGKCTLMVKILKGNR